jgi:hypothetical protein
MARRTVFLVMTAVATLRIVQSLNGVDIDKISPVAFRNEIPTKVCGGKIRIYSATLMTVKTERLIVALGAVVARLARKGAVAARPVAIVVGCNPFTLVAVIAFGELHFGVFFV